MISRPLGGKKNAKGSGAHGGGELLSGAATAAQPQITLDRVAGNVFTVNGTLTHAARSIGAAGVLLLDGVFRPVGG